jgi:peptidoglycan glycosyltransferase
MLDDGRGNVRRTSLAIVAGLCLIALVLGYWQVWRAADLGSDQANPRVANARLFQPRGRILDRGGQPLATSETTSQGARRRYTDPSLVHTIGLHSPRFGDTNLEAAFDAELRGERSPSTFERLLAELLHRPAQPADLTLTIDKRVHDAAMAALGTASGAVVALDPRSGEVLALASRPFFDPNAPDDALARLQSDPGQPLFNRAVQATYVPGSTFKTVTAAAVLDKDLVDSNQAFRCTTAVRVGTYAVDCRNSQHVPRLTYKQAFAWSSNRAFGLSGLLLGVSPSGPMNAWLDDQPPGPYPLDMTRSSAGVLEDYARRFGFGRRIPFDFPVSESRVKRADTEWTPELLVQTAFGQGELQATPFHMALIAATVANGGRVPTPYVAASLRAAGATRMLHQPGEFSSIAVSEATARTLVEFMVEGVQNGYASRSAIPGVTVGGKTGTAEVGDGTSHAWFIGFAPAEAPRVAIAVILEHQGSGSDVAAPAAQRVLRAALDVVK